MIRNVMPRDVMPRGWQKPGRCEPNGGNCVEVNLDEASEDRIQVRDSKIVDSPVLTYTRAEWLAHLEAVRNGQYDLT